MRVHPLASRIGKWVLELILLYMGWRFLDSITLLFNNIRFQLPVLPETTELAIIGIVAIILAIFLIIGDIFRWAPAKYGSWKQAAKKTPNRGTSETYARQAVKERFRAAKEGRQKDIWEAIREWMESPIRVGFGVDRGSADFLLATDPPKLGAEVDACLRKHYPSVWNTLQEFRTKHATPTRSVTLNGIALENAIVGLTGLNARLVKQLKSEILDKHYTRLKVD